MKTALMPVRPSEVFTTTDLCPSSKMPDEGKSSTSIFLDRVKSLDLAEKKSLCSQRATMWRVIDIALKVAVIGAAFLFTVYTWTAFSTVSFLLRSVVILTVALVSYSTINSYCFEIEKEYLDDGKLAGAIEEERLKIEKDEEYLKRLCKKHGINRLHFDSNVLTKLLAEVIYKEKEIADLAETQKKASPEDENFSELTKKEKALHSETHLSHKIAIIKTQAAALIAFLKKPQEPLPEAYFFIYGDLNEAFWLHTVVGIKNQKPRTFVKIALPENREKKFTFQEIWNSSLEDLANEFTP